MTIETRLALAATIPAAPVATRGEPLAHGQAQRAAEGRSRQALHRAATVAFRGETPANLDRRLYGGLTIREALTSAGISV